MKKIKLLVPYVEAGFGHIMAAKAIADSLEKKYSDYIDVQRIDFFKNYGLPLEKFEKRMCAEVVKYNKDVAYGYVNTFAMDALGGLSLEFVMKCVVKGAYEDGVKRMAELAPDAVLSTHWATNYYAENAENKPYTITYGPDAHLNPFFCYKSDLTLISVPEGYKSALKKKRRFNKDNLKLVPTAIRAEAFDVKKKSKAELREKLGLKNEFTVLVMDGGYGVGLTEKLSKAIVEKDLPVTVIAACGKNADAFGRLSELKPSGKTTLVPLPFCTNIIEYLAASDLYFGKSGSGLAEPAFFGIPTGVTHSANEIEKLIADHYVKTVGIAKRTGTVRKCIKLVRAALDGNAAYAKMQEASGKLQPFGGDGIADAIFSALSAKFNLTENTNE